MLHHDLGDLDRMAAILVLLISFILGKNLALLSLYPNKAVHLALRWFGAIMAKLNCDTFGVQEAYEVTQSFWVVTPYPSCQVRAKFEHDNGTSIRYPVWLQESAVLLARRVCTVDHSRPPYITGVDCTVPTCLVLDRGKKSNLGELIK